MVEWSPTIMQALDNLQYWKLMLTKMRRDRVSTKVIYHLALKLKLHIPSPKLEEEAMQQLREAN